MLLFIFRHLKIRFYILHMLEHDEFNVCLKNPAVLYFSSFPILVVKFAAHSAVTVSNECEILRR